jgi:hypothetical protein
MIMADPNDGAEDLRWIFADACAQGGRETTPKDGWGTHWMGLLHDGFANRYRGEPVQVISRREGSGVQFGTVRMAEFMYDIAVVMSHAGSPPLFTPGHEKQFTPIGRALWLVEFEVATRSFAVAADLSKLILGDADNKLLVTKERRNVAKFNEFLFGVARACQGNLFVAFISSYAKTGFSNEWRAERGAIEYSLWRRGPQAFEPMTT